MRIKYYCHFDYHWFEFIAVDTHGRGILYKNNLDCVAKIYKTEGIAAFYKGVGAIYFRLGPHTVLCLMFWDIFRDMYDRYVTHVQN